jgi:integrase
LNGYRRWVPWLSAYTGARLEEICQALVTDVRHDKGIWYLDICGGPGKSLKNLGSARRVPLHSALIRDGFLDYLRSVSNDGLLFSDVRPDRFGRKSGNVSKWYGRWSRKLGITDPRKVAHSWRHRFKDLCREAHVDKSVNDALTGHVNGSVGDQYGKGYSLRILAEAIERLPDQIGATGLEVDNISYRGS